MHTYALIENAEKTFVKPLETFFRKIYDDEKFPSHGLEHHRRVWNYAKEILIYLDNYDQKFINKLLISCYLHDIGMVVENDIKHGRHSSEICRSFLKENNLDEKSYQDVLYAIENHDNKDYNSGPVENRILTILSVADDLDAFGETGISRYIEIYRKRGIEAHLIKTSVLENARRRFDNFERIFKKYTDLVNKHKKRYRILCDFFENQDT